MEEDSIGMEHTGDKIIYTRTDGTTKEIDLTPVNEITNNLENILKKRENFSDRSHIAYSVEIMKKMRGLDKDQLEYLANNFVGLITRYADMLQRVYDSPEEECKKIKEYKEFSALIKNYQGINEGHVRKGGLNNPASTTKPDIIPNPRPRV